MKPFTLFLFSLLPPWAMPSICPKQCNCLNTNSIFCSQRRSSVMPRNLPSTTSHLYLFQNGIETLNQDDFWGLDNLEMLDMSQNKLKEVPDRVFSLLSSLHNLDLSSNKITYIFQNSFFGLVLLERLYLYNNRIQNIHPGAFEGLVKLLELKLQGNHLMVLPPLHRPSLLLLDLSYNYLQMPNPADLQTPNLETLKMAGLGLVSLRKDLMANLGNLHDLDISENQLRAVPSALQELRGLTRLKMAGNPVGQLKLEDFQNLEMLQQLDISNFNLHGFPEGFAKLFPRLELLTVAENPFNCQCSLAWFPVWIRSRQLQLARTQETRCHFPPLIAGKLLENVEHGDFGCSTTTTIMTDKITNNSSQTLLITPQAGKTNAMSSSPPNNIAFIEVDSYPPPPAPASPSSSTNDNHPAQLCPDNICLNGGICQLERFGQIKCLCPHGTTGINCEKIEGPPPVEVSTMMMTLQPDISSREVTSTTILLDLHHYIELHPYIRGIRLTYTNLSGLDQRPLQLSVPASYPEYTLRGLQPNSIYSVCASPMGELSGRDSSCTQVQTASQQLTPKAQFHRSQFTTTVVPGLVVMVLCVGVAAVTGTICYLRRKRAKEHIHLGCEPLPLQLEEAKACLENGMLPLKQSELMSSQPAVQNSIEYEIPLMQTHCTGNNNIVAFKPSFFDADCNSDLQLKRQQRSTVSVHCQSQKGTAMADKFVQ